MHQTGGGEGGIAAAAGDQRLLALRALNTVSSAAPGWSRRLLAPHASPELRISALLTVSAGSYGSIPARLGTHPFVQQLAAAAPLTTILTTIWVRSARSAVVRQGSAKPLTCGYAHLQTTADPPADNWGSRGRRFKSCQPDRDRRVRGVSIESGGPPLRGCSNRYSNAVEYSNVHQPRASSSRSAAFRRCAGAT
jgi:hypothetical protein